MVEKVFALIWPRKICLYHGQGLCDWDCSAPLKLVLFEKCWLRETPLGGLCGLGEVFMVSCPTFPPPLPLLALWSWSSLIFLCYLICSKLKQSSRTPLPASLSFSKQNRCKFSNFLTAMRGWHFQVASSILVWLCQGCVNVDDLRKKMHETQIKSHLQRLRQSFRAWSTEEALPISGYIQLCSILSMWSHDKLFETCFTLTSLLGMARLKMTATTFFNSAVKLNKEFKMSCQKEKSGNNQKCQEWEVPSALIKT